MKILLSTFLAFFAAATAVFGQMERTFYQSYEIDSAKSINLDLTPDYDLQAWAGNTILIETHIQLFEASPAILDYFIKHGRYEIKMDKSPLEVSLRALLPDRKPIRTAHGDCTEVATVKIFVPDTFNWSVEDKQHLLLKPVTN
jgi:hypothetical protein